MLRNKVFLTVLLLSAVFARSLCADTVSTGALADRYLEKANVAYEDGDLETAYKNVNVAIKLSGGVVPANVLVFARSIYTARLQRIQKSYDERQFIEIKTDLGQYPDVENAAIKKLVLQIEAKLTADEKAELKKGQEEFYSKIAESAEATQTAAQMTQQAVIEQGQQLQEQNKLIQEQTEQMRDDSKRTQRSIVTILIVVAVCVFVILVIVALIVVIVRAAVRHSQVQQQQYTEAFKLLAQNQSQTNRLMLGGVTDLYGNGLKSAGSSRWGVDALPEPEQTPEEKEEVRELAEKCSALGEKIDKLTGRRNNSKNVSELVYKLAVHLNIQQNTAMIYFCAAMVYDAGMLGIDPALFNADNLTDEQRHQLANHTEMAEEYLQFVPKRYWDTFDCAARMHHENMDGSGPAGVKGDDIPKIARLIRAADSFIALSSSRNYKQICDKETAIAKLAEQPEIYDPEIIEAMRDIV